MRLTTWNIRAGGGKRTKQIADVLIEEDADVLVLTEYRTKPGKALLALLESCSYHVVAGVPPGAENSVCILSRMPMNDFVCESIPKSSHRWVPVTIPTLDLTILGVHVPNQDEIWNKREFWDCLETFANENVNERTLLVGDMNTALDEDHQGTPIREAAYFQRLLDAGWIDAWRAMNSSAQEYTWYSHRNNGFRLDYCFASPPLAALIRNAYMRHDVRTELLSDHSLLTVDLDLTP